MYVNKKWQYGLYYGIGNRPRLKIRWSLVTQRTVYRYVCSLVVWYYYFFNNKNMNASEILSTIYADNNCIVCISASSGEQRCKIPSKLSRFETLKRD